MDSQSKTTKLFLVPLVHPIIADQFLLLHPQRQGQDVADRFTATVRAADFKLGHSSRRGMPGRALVDSKGTLVLNWDFDWSDGVRIHGLSEASSMELKKDIADLSTKEAFGALENLNPVKFFFKKDKEKQMQIGFISGPLDGGSLFVQLNTK